MIFSTEHHVPTVDQTFQVQNLKDQYDLTHQLFVDLNYNSLFKEIKEK